MKPVLLALLLAGCVAPPQKVYHADGQAALAVECYELGKCHEQMVKACRGAYRPIDQTSMQEYLATSSFYIHRITFRCK